jgi:hypothetical protein
MKQMRRRMMSRYLLSVEASIAAVKTSPVLTLPSLTLFMDKQTSYRFCNFRYVYFCLIVEQVPKSAICPPIRHKKA